MVPKHPLLLAAALAIIWQGPAYANSIRSNADPSDEDPSDFTPFRLGDSDEVMPKANFRLPPPKDVDGGMTDDSEDYVDSDYSGTFRDPLGISLGLKHNSDKPSQDEAKIAPTEEDPAIPARRLPVSASEKPPATPEIITPKQLDKENTNPSAPEFVPDGRAIVLENQPAESNEKPPIPPPSSEPSPTVEPPQSPASDPTPPTAKSVDVITPQPAVIASAAADGGQVAPPEPTPVESHTTSSDKGAKNTWIAVIGIIVSVGLCVCVGGLLFCLRRQRVKKSEAMKNGSFLRTSIQARSSTPGGTLNVKSPPKPSAFVVSLPSPTEAVFLDRGGEHDLFAHDTTPSDAALRPHASFSTEAISPNTARKRPSQSLSPRQMGEQQQPLRRSSSGINLNKKGLSAQGSGMIRSNSIEFGQMSPSGATGRKDRWQNIDLAPDQQSTPEDSPRQGVHTASQVALQVNSALQANAERPKRLLAFINPFGGKRLAPTVYQNVVSPLFNLAGVHVEVVVTERGGHAAEVVGREDLGRWDGLVAVGGDGFFSEVLNALTHRSDRPETLRIGLIPGGSTNCVVQTAQGANDPVTATLQIITGARLAHDLCLVSAGDMRKYAASMVAYGFYGDIIANSNSLRWMGPTRYDYTGLQMFMRKQSYPMKMYLRLANIQRGTGGVCVSGCAHCPKDPPTCEISILHDDEKGASAAAMLQTLESMSEEELSREGWKIVDGKFICINVLATACKSPHAPKGMAPHAHLSDGCLEVVLVRDCAHPLYLAHLACLANPKADHFDFDFVENYKVKEAVFAAPGGAAGAAGGEIQGNWMADGELFPNGVVHLKARSNFVHVFGTRPYFPPSVTPNLKLKPSEIVDCQVGSGSGEGGTAGVVGAGEKGAPTAV